jgi:HSP20 family protein
MGNLMKRNDRNGLFPAIFNRYWDDDFFNNFMGADLPAVNVKENKKEFKLEISAPGFEKNDIALNVENNVLTISAKKEMKNEEKGEDEKVLRQEFTSSSFYRSFTLPENIDTEHISAKEKNGVLKISLPKLEKALEDKKKKIEIK